MIKVKKVGQERAAKKSSIFNEPIHHLYLFETRLNLDNSERTHDIFIS